MRGGTGAAMGAQGLRRPTCICFLRTGGFYRRSEGLASASATSRSITRCSAKPCPMKSFPPGSDWLMLGPSGPRRLRLAVEYLAQYRGGICFLVDLDPRWVNKLIQYGKHQELDLYKNHVIDQALNILRAHDNIQCLFHKHRSYLKRCPKRSPCQRLA